MQWSFKPPYEPQQELFLSQELQISKTLASLLAQRGITSFNEAKQFFRPELSDLHDPFLMKDMTLAVDRILSAIENKEHILVYGDYDVDGTTSVALISTFLKTLTPLVATYVPDRYDEGYGISYQGIDFASDNDISLVIALDCGIKAIDKIAYAKTKHIDFIICDHHRPGTEIPKAVAVLDPKRSDCSYPYKELCGCGVGFKLIQGLAINLDIDFNELYPFLDLVAVAIAADIVPITGENRVLAHYGMQVINQSPRTGIKALMSGSNKAQLNITDVVFMIAPRINAAGRMKHGLYAVDLLTQTNTIQAKEASKQIEAFNSNRKNLDQTITQEALNQIDHLNENHRFTTVVYDANWHKGVIGIVASRLIETYYRPTLVFTKSGDKLAASARSVKGFDVYQALEACSDWIDQFGGHKYAAGLTIHPEHYDAFKNAFENVVKDTIPESCLSPMLQIDQEITLDQLTDKFYRILKQFGPFGPGNMKPVFVARGLRDNGFGKTVGADQKHLKLNIIQGADSKTYPAIGFGLGNYLQDIEQNQTFSAAFTVEENHWNGITSLQLNLKDIKIDT